MSLMRALLAAACLVCAAVPVRAAEPAVKSRVGPPGGTLLIVGGGAMGGLWDVFFGLAGGRESAIVVIPTAAATVEGEDSVLGVLRARGASKVSQLHTKDRVVDDSEEFCAPLRAARGVWITGGRQWQIGRAHV